MHTSIVCVRTSLAHNTFHLMPCYKCGIFRIWFCFFHLFLLFSALFLYTLAVYRHRAITIRSFLSFFRNGLFSRLVCTRWLVVGCFVHFVGMCHCLYLAILFQFGCRVRYKWGNNIPCNLSKLWVLACECLWADRWGNMSQCVCVPNSSYTNIASLGGSSCTLYIVHWTIAQPNWNICIALLFLSNIKMLQ